MPDASQQPGLEAEMDEAPDFTPRYPGSGRLEGRTALITGGDSGIGRAIAVLFAREGANVAIGYLDEDRDADDTLRLIEEEGAEGIALKGDVADPETCRRIAEEAVSQFGSVDILVNNAAVQFPQTELTDISPEQLLKTFSTNIFSQFYLTQALLPQMGAGASIINVSSVTAFKGQETLADYSATKGAIIAFTRALSKMLASRGIRVNAIAPGPIWTPLIPATFPEEKVERHGQDVPLGRKGQPNEVAPCALFLACEDSSYITGQTLHPNGGELVGS